MNVLSIEQIDCRLNDCFRLLTGGSRTAVAAPAHTQGNRGLELRPALGLGAPVAAAALGIRRGMDDGGGGGGDVGSTAANGKTCWISCRAWSKSHSSTSTATSMRADGIASSKPCVSTRGSACSNQAKPNALRDRHLAFFDELVRRAEPELTRAGQVTWLNRLHREHDNLRLALERCLEAPERGEQSLELAAALCWFWLKRGYFREGQECLERALSASGNKPSALRAKALMSLGCMTFFQGDFVRTRALLEESATLGRAAGDLSVVGFSLGMTRNRCPGAWRHRRRRPNRHRRAGCGSRERNPMGAGSVSCLSRVPGHARR